MQTEQLSRVFRGRGWGGVEEVLIHLMNFPAGFTKETTFATSYLLSCTSIPSKNGSALKRGDNSYLLE